MIENSIHADNLTTWVTPEVAKKWLKKNKKNRPLNKYRVMRYSEDMKAGRWEFTGEAIRFSEDDTLLDGQHRLTACVEANTPFPSIVLRGIKNEAQLVMDQGMARTKASQLSLLGYKRTRPLASAATALWRIQGGRARLRTHGATPSNGEVMSIIRNTHDLIPRLEEFYGFPHTPGLRVRHGEGVAMFVLMARHNEPKAREFFSGYLEGAGLASGSPMLAFRNKILQARTKGHKIQGEEFITWMAYGWRSHLKGKKISRISTAMMLPSFPGDPGWDAMEK